jgi:hypothetical protein
MAREDRLDPVGEAGGDGGIEGMPRPAAHDPRGHLRAGDHPLDAGVAGDVRDAHGERDLRAAREAELALAVPALGEAGEQPLDRGRQADPVGQHRGDLAGRLDVAAVGPDRARQLAGDAGRPHRRRSFLRHERAQRGERGLPLRPEHGGPQVRQHPGLAEQVRRDVRVRGAADVEQQARVVGLPLGLGVDAEPLGQPHRGERALEPVLEREPGGEVRGQ